MAITAKFEADFTQFVGAVKNAEGSLKSLETGAKTVGPAILASLTSTELRRFAGDVRQVANEFIGAFAEEEAAVKKLNTALQAQGTGEALAQYKALAAEFQRTTTFSDELIVSMQALLVQVGGVMPGQMQAALTAATNLSAGLGISLEAATLLVAKAFGQGGEQLGKLKALLGDTVPKGADMAAVMEAINSKFGGQATAQLETYSGKMTQLANQMSDFKEKIGELLVNALTPLITAFAAMPQGMQTVIVGAVAIGTALAPLALSIGALVPLVTALGAAFGITLVGALAAITPFLLPAGAIIAGAIAVYAAFKNWNAIVGIAQAIYEGIKTWLVDRFNAVVESIRAKVAAVTGFFRDMYTAVVGQSYIPDMVEGIKTSVAQMDDVLVKPIAVATEKAASHFGVLKDIVVGAGNPYANVGRFSSVDTGTAFRPVAFAGGGGGGGGSVTFNTTLNGMLSTNDSHTKQQIRDLLFPIIAEALAGQRKL